jgi:hypothetical protein
LWLHRRAEVRQDRGVTGIGRGQLSGRFRDVTPWRGLTTTAGNLAVTSAATTGISKPPLASRTISMGATACIRAMRSAMLAASLLTAQRAPSGRLAQSRRCFDTSIPKTVESSVSRCLLHMALPCDPDCSSRQLFELRWTGRGDQRCSTISGVSVRTVYHVPLERR